MIGAVRGIVLWVYDFLAEDTVLVIGTVAAIVATIFIADLTKLGAGFVLWAVILAAIAVSLGRTAARS